MAVTTGVREAPRGEEALESSCMDVLPNLLPQRLRAVLRSPF
jgi:hypothetical protein